MVRVLVRGRLGMAVAPVPGDDLFEGVRQLSRLVGRHGWLGRIDRRQVAAARVALL